MNEEPIDELERIRFVVAHFNQLQGLRGVAVGVSYVAVFGPTLAMAGPAPGDRAWMIAFPALFVVLVPWMLALDRYYKREFGRLVGPVGSDRTWMLWSATIGVAAIAGPSKASLFIALAAWSLWAVIRDWPHRRHYLIDIAACLVALTAFAPTSGLNEMGAVMAGFAIIGVPFVITGFLDHRLLVTTMRQSSAAWQSRCERR